MSRSISIPSNRNFGESHIGLDSAYNYGVECIVSDNSQCPNKRSAYPQSMISEPCGMIDNFYRAFNATRGDYVLTMGDDDRIYKLNDNDIETDAIGIHPAVICFTPQQGIIRAESIELLADTAIERVKQHEITSQGANTAFFSFWRRDIIKSLYDLWYLHHPTKATYCDWAIMNALASSGKLIRDPSTVYFYNAENWYGDNEFVTSKVEKSYVDSGLPASAAAYKDIFKRIDSFIFIMRDSSPVPYQEKLDAAMYCFDGEDFQDVLEIVSSFGLGDKYKEFYKIATDKEWGEY